MECPNCGAENPEEKKFCGDCGKELTSIDVINCKYCGAENPRVKIYCGECGERLGKRSRSWKDLAYWNLSPEEKRRRNLYGVIGLILFLLIAIMFIPFLDSTFTVHVNSNHLLTQVHYYLYINGDQRADGILNPGDGITWTLAYHYAWQFSNEHTATISATGIGGALGDTNDEETLKIVSGNSYELTLTV